MVGPAEHLSLHLAMCFFSDCLMLFVARVDVGRICADRFGQSRAFWVGTLGNMLFNLVQIQGCPQRRQYPTHYLQSIEVACAVAQGLESSATF